MVNIIYLDDDDNVVTKENSTHFVAQTLDENGVLIEETFGSTKKLWEIENQNDLVGEPTPEMQEILDSITDKNGNYIFRK